jgi:hypothetical protein
VNVSLHVLDVRSKGVKVATPASTDVPFWLPRASVTWSAEPEPGAKLTATVPRWLATKHHQLLKLRGQYAIPLNPTPGLDPDKAQGAFPMADDNRGALFRIPDDEKKNDRWPDMRGDLTIDGVKYKLAGWTKSDKNGRKYLALTAKPADEQRQQPEQQNAYAAAKGRQVPAGGPTFDREDSIPFAPEVR